MSKPESHIVQLVHPDYPTPVEQLNEAYERHTAQVQMVLQNFVDLNLKLSDSELGDIVLKLADVIEEAAKIHQPYANTKWYQRRCKECHQTWPCSTAQVLDQANAVNFIPTIDTADKKP